MQHDSLSRRRPLPGSRVVPDVGRVRSHGRWERAAVDRYRWQRQTCWTSAGRRQQRRSRGPEPAPIVQTGDHHAAEAGRGADPDDRRLWARRCNPGSYVCAPASSSRSKTPSRVPRNRDPSNLLATGSFRVDISAGPANRAPRSCASSVSQRHRPVKPSRSSVLAIDWAGVGLSESSASRPATAETARVPRHHR